MGVSANLFINKRTVLEDHNIIGFENPCYKTVPHFVLNAGCIIRGSQKVPGILRYLLFGAL
jgi:hypothetical protein